MKFVESAVLCWLVAGTDVRAQFPRSAVDPALSDRGGALYARDCARCHGEDTRGTGTAPDLLRSTLVLHDRREMLKGSELAAYLKSTPPHNLMYNASEAADLSQFLTLSINKILRSGYDTSPQQLLSGDAAAGKAYFDGAGGCAKCHSVTGDLAGIGKRYTPLVLQQKILFPGIGVGVKTKTAVTVATGARTYTGELVRADDFTVALRDKDGTLRSFNRTSGMHVTMVDPFAPHDALLDKLTDADIHNLTTYLDALQ